MDYLHVVDHPLLKQSLTVLRDKNTSTDDFRRHTAVVGQIMITEATRQLSVNIKEVETPLKKTTGYEIKRSIIFVPVLRAGISMLFPARDFLAWAPVGFIGLERDEKTALAREYYQKFPEGLEDKTVLILDPMLATGGSLSDTIEALKKKGARNFSVVTIVAAPEGIARIRSQHPKVHIYTAAVDECLNEHKYIVPGLGDFGDRYFGT